MNILKVLENVLFLSICRFAGLFQWIYWSGDNNSHSCSCYSWLIHLGGYQRRKSAKANETGLK